MGDLKFEKVDIADAKRILNTVPGVNIKDSNSNIEKTNWKLKRKPQVDIDLKLQPSTEKWAQGLPAHLYPKALCEKFPRVANNIARSWRRPLICEKVFDELLMDHRGTRQGFPQEIANEIVSLKDYHSTVLYPDQKDIWKII